MVDITGFAVSASSGFTDHLANLHGSELIVFEIAAILILSAILAFIAKILKQPLVPAYVIAGILLSLFLKNSVSDFDSLLELVIAFSEIGIALLLFIAGLEISFKKIKEANLKKISIIGTLQIAAVFGLSMLMSSVLNLTTMQAVYIGIIMAFGSTMVVIKLLAEKNELVTMHGRLVLGILLLQDLFAIIAIVLLTSGGFALAPIGIAALKLFAILAFAIILQKFILNKLFRFAAQSTELLLLSALGVLFLFILLSSLAGISIVIGAFVAGVSLANSPFKLELESRISPLRDFFSILFFVALGMQIRFTAERIDLFIFLLAVAFIIKPLITIFLLRTGGYRPKTSFETGVSLAQLSEFSLIIGSMGFLLGVLDQAIWSTVVLATIISMSVTTYFVEYKRGMYNLWGKGMKVFKFLPIKENLTYIDDDKKTILLVGAHRMGSIVLKELLEKNKKELLVLDYNPEVINALNRQKISCIYGDLASPELLEVLKVQDLKTVISTVPGVDDGMILLEKIRKHNPKVKMIMTASRISGAEELYKAGADYVILPKVSAGEDILPLINKPKKELAKKRRVHQKRLSDAHKILY